MKTKPHSEEHMRFENLLGRIVSVPAAEVKKRMEEDRTSRDCAKENGQRSKRARPIVSPAAVASSKTRV
jgi:hypothetical protein